MEWQDSLQAVVTQLLIGAGGGGVVALGLFKYFGERWLNSRAEARTAADRHVREQELVNLRDRISRQFDRVTKLSQREFEVLPDLWAKIVDAFSATENASSRIRRFPDLARLSNEQFHAFLERSDLPQAWKEELAAVEGHDRLSRYGRALDLQAVAKAREKTVDAHFALAKTGIFLPGPIHAELEQLKEFVWRAVLDIGFEIEDRVDNIRDRDKERPGELFRRQGRRKLEDAEKLVRTRLSSEEPAA